MKINKIIGTTYLCSKFTNHDGTQVSDHPLYLFETDSGKWLGVMFTQKTNSFTAKWKDGNDITFICCSDHSGEYPTRKVFQAEVYVIDKNDKNLKYSEYSFKYHCYNQDLLKALKNALNVSNMSVHNYNEKEEREDSLEVIDSLKEFVNNIITKSNYAQCPTKGIANTQYNEFKKFNNNCETRKENKNVWKKLK